MYVFAMLGSTVASAGLFWGAFVLGITALAAVGTLLLAWATISMFAGRMLLPERRGRKE